VKPRQSHKVQSWIIRDSSLLYWITVSVEDGQLNHTEVKAVSRTAKNRCELPMLSVKKWHYVGLVKGTATLQNKFTRVSVGSEVVNAIHS
jgi:hypothetical protein